MTAQATNLLPEALEDLRTLCLELRKSLDFFLLAVALKILTAQKADLHACVGSETFACGEALLEACGFALLVDHLRVKLVPWLRREEDMKSYRAGLGGVIAWKRRCSECGCTDCTDRRIGEIARGAVVVEGDHLCSGLVFCLLCVGAEGKLLVMMKKCSLIAGCIVGYLLSIRSGRKIVCAAVCRVRSECKQLAKT